MNLRLNSLVRARSVFEEYSKHLGSDQERTGAIKMFELCYELSWKIMKRIIVKDGDEVTTMQSIFRKAALKGLIDDPEVWFEFLDLRNVAVHTYDLQNVELVIGAFYRFGSAVDLLIGRIKSMIVSQVITYDL